MSTGPVITAQEVNRNGIRRLGNTTVAEEEAGKHYANKKYYQRSFKDQDLSNADFRGAHLVECNFNGSDLSYANLTDANCMGSSFVDARMYRINLMRANLAKTTVDPLDLFGATVTLTCDTFEDMKLSPKYRAFWIYLASLFVAPEGEKMKLREIIGPETYEFFERVRKRDW